MIIDSQLLFSSSQDITDAAASTNCLDLGAVRDIGTGEPLYLFVNVEVAFVGASVTLVVALQGDSTESFTPDGTETVMTIPALAAAGNVYIARLNPASAPLQYQYIRLYYTPTGGGGALEAGTISAGITHSIQRAVHYADNVTITE